MTNSEILQYMQIRYDAVASQDAPGYEDDDYTLFFNKAQKVFLKSNYNDFANPSHIGAEESEKRSKDLVLLKSHSVISTSSVGNHINSQVCDLPENCFVVLKEECVLSYTDCNGDLIAVRIPVKPIKEDYYNANIKNPYKKPYEELIWRLDRERTNITDVNSLPRHELILFDGATFVNYRISYYRVPKEVDLNNNNDFCELPVIQHEKIADMAVEFMMQTTGRAELQTKSIENSKIIE